MKILIVEDTRAKADRVVKCVTSVGGIGANDVVVAGDVVSARDSLRTQLFDILILDIRLPNLTGDDPEEMGVDLIRELRTSTTLLKPSHIIGLTAYDETLQQVIQSFADEVWHVIKYDESSTRWCDQLSRKLNYLVGAKAELARSGTPAYMTDVAIITALHDPELKAVLQLNANWKVLPSGNDATVYHAGTFEDSTRRLKVVAAAAPQMGMPAAAVLSLKLINRFRPRYLVMLGIAAATPGDGRDYGDILVADRCWNYEAGKKVVDGKICRFLPEPAQIPLSTSLRESFLNVKAQRLYLNEIQERWTAQEFKSRLDLHVGPIASGSAVVADANFRDGLKDQQHRKLIGIDMEAYSVYYAADNSDKPHPIPICLKGVCDFADPEKDARYQQYAAYTSASLFYRFALDYLEPIG